MNIKKMILMSIVILALKNSSAQELILNNNNKRIITDELIDPINKRTKLELNKEKWAAQVKRATTVETLMGFLQNSGEPIDSTGQFQSATVSNDLSNSDTEIVELQGIVENINNQMVDIFSYDQNEFDNKNLKIKEGVNLENVCSTCSHVAKSDSCLKQHISRHHSKAVNLICNKCNPSKKFDLLDSYNKHIKRHESKKFVCGINGCNKMFHTKQELTNHLKSRKHNIQQMSLVEGYLQMQSTIN